jgi:hypothetical protein
MKRSLFALVLISVLAGIRTANAQGIRPSEFNDATPDTFWNFFDPRGGCVLTMTGTHASIAIPSGLSRDPVSFGQGGNRAPRLVQRVGPPGSDVGDFGLIVKFDGVQTRQYQIQGIEAIQDDKNYVRCEFFSDSSGIKALLYTYDNVGNYETQKINLLTSVPRGTTPLYLRLDRWVNAFMQYYSSDGGLSWTFIDSAHHTINVDSVAVYAANSDSIQLPREPEIHAPAFEGLIDYFRVTTVLPVQLATFSATLLENNFVRLDWSTLSETNNLGFEIQKSQRVTGQFATIPNSFVPGHGTTLEPHYYTYTDSFTSAGKWDYRLKQIDFDGDIHYTEPIHVYILTGVDGTEESSPTEFVLHQNYPNPFNPTTIIRYALPKESHVTLEVYNLLGQKVATLVDATRRTGIHNEAFDASELSSGVYMYKLSASGQTFTRKMILAR